MNVEPMRLFIDEQARDALQEDAWRWALIQAGRQTVPVYTVLGLFAKRIVDLVVYGAL